MSSTTPPPDAPWHVALAYALVGVHLELPGRGTPDASALLNQLADLGWDADRIRGHARDLTAAEQLWPHQVPDDLRTGLGAAQLHAAFAEARERLGLGATVGVPRSARVALNADERRLLADVPPHHVAL